MVWLQVEQLHLHLQAPGIVTFWGVSPKQLENIFPLWPRWTWKDIFKLRIGLAQNGFPHWGHRTGFVGRTSQDTRFSIPGALVWLQVEQLHLQAPVSITFWGVSTMKPRLTWKDISEPTANSHKMGFN